MVMNKVKGNMYNFVSHTWNPIRGKCSHDCVYCYMKVFPQKELRLVESELIDDLGEGNFIFVGSSTDMFAKDVSTEWINTVLLKCRDYSLNKYLFQTKNPMRFDEFSHLFPEKSVFATTIESNRTHKEMNNSPSLFERYDIFKELDFGKRMITIEPIMDFELSVFVDWIKDIAPFQVAIGADSKGHNLSEPSGEKVKLLIEELEKFTKVIQKDNLKRIFNKQEKNDN